MTPAIVITVANGMVQAVSTDGGALRIFVLDSSCKGPFRGGVVQRYPVERDGALVAAVLASLGRSGRETNGTEHDQS